MIVIFYFSYSIYKNPMYKDTYKGSFFKLNLEQQMLPIENRQQLKIKIWISD
jgi:hypothetical protein